MYSKYDLNQLLELANHNKIKYVNMMNFIENYTIETIIRHKNSYAVIGMSNLFWIYIMSEDREEFINLIRKIESYKFYAVLTDEQLMWLKELSNVEMIMTCKKLYLPSSIECAKTSKQVVSIDCSYDQYIYENYQYKEFVDIKYIHTLMVNNKTLGIFDDSKLVAWLLVHDDGAMGFLTVLPQYRRKGYATLLNNGYINMLREQGKIPFVHIEEDNIKSMNLALKTGFVDVGRVHWVKVLD